MKALRDLVTDGKVRDIEASSMWARQLAHYNHIAGKARFLTFSLTGNEQIAHSGTDGPSLFRCRASIRWIEDREMGK
jgi:aryl-alcohol dehydrogenase-like predicted oxidoreductase